MNAKLVSLFACSFVSVATIAPAEVYEAPIERVESYKGETDSKRIANALKAGVNEMKIRILDDIRTHEKWLTDELLAGEKSRDELIKAFNARLEGSEKAAVERRADSYQVDWRLKVRRYKETTRNSSQWRTWTVVAELSARDSKNYEAFEWKPALDAFERGDLCKRESESDIKTETKHQVAISQRGPTGPGSYSGTSYCGASANLICKLKRSVAVARAKGDVEQTQLYEKAKR